ncbi:MAG: nickel pincer cofactor biosynthesis protein LarC, partial [Actinomycetota bacterium]|nr:nickel pincer cofactor biosynthesis protein LarC [Actinomycetota bacterium]
GLGVDGYALSFERVQRGGIAACRANVVTADHGAHDDGVHGHEHRHRRARDVRAIVAAADLPEAVRDRAQRVFAALADAEGAVHGVPADDVEFHEVGALDALVDVVGVCAALHDLGIATVHSSPIAIGHGTVRAAHGELPNPPPAVARLLAARSVPIVGVDTTMELSTPTGVAILVALAATFGPLPGMTVDSIGYGAGSADPPGRPNGVQAVVGAPTAPSATPRPGRAAVQLEANVDDVTGEVLAHTIATLVAAGAHDAWATPIVMKKGRPAHTVAALVDPVDVDRLAAILLAETGSLGLRAVTVERWPQQREEACVDVGGHPVRVKRAAGRVKVEHDDAVAAARALGRPLRDILRDAEAETDLSFPTGPDGPIGKDSSGLDHDY